MTHHGPLDLNDAQEAMVSSWREGLEGPTAEFDACCRAVAAIARLAKTSLQADEGEFLAHHVFRVSPALDAASVMFHEVSYSVVTRGPRREASLRCETVAAPSEACGKKRVKFLAFARKTIRVEMEWGPPDWENRSGIRARKARGRFYASTLPTNDKAAIEANKAVVRRVEPLLRAALRRTVA